MTASGNHTPFSPLITVPGWGSVQLRRALIDLGIGLWHADPAARR